MSANVGTFNSYHRIYVFTNIEVGYILNLLGPITLTYQDVVPIADSFFIFHHLARSHVDTPFRPLFICRSSIRLPLCPRVPVCMSLIKRTDGEFAFERHLYYVLLVLLRTYTLLHAVFASLACKLGMHTRW